MAHMSALRTQTIALLQDYARTVRSRIPVKYHKLLSITCAVIGFWSIRNLFWKIANRIRNYPPGPHGLPYFGCFFPFGLTPSRFLVDIAHSYGPVAYVPLLLTRNLFVADPAILRQLYKSQKVTARPHLTTRKVNAFGVLSGKEWWSRRKYAMETVLSLAQSSFVLQGHLRSMQSAAPKMNRRNVEQKELWYPHDTVHYFIINASFATIFDHVLEVDDPFIPAFCHQAQSAAQSVGVGILVDLFSNFSGFELFSKWFLWRIHDDADNQLIEWMKANGFQVDRDRKILKRVKMGNLATAKKNTRTKVYADFLIDKLESGQMEYDQIWAEFESMFAASIDTQAHTATFGFLLLAKFPKIQQRVYDEIGTLRIFYFTLFFIL